jgi:group I intron endonuclease
MSKSNKICGIYKITLITNGKFYIGSSIDIKIRWNNHKNELKKGIHGNKKLQNACNKYGYNNFIFEILEECEKVKEIILEREQFYIDTLNPFFNICKVAGNCLGIKRNIETIQKIINSKTGKKLTNDHCKKISDSHKGINHTKETKEKISIRQIGKKNHNFGKIGENNKRSLMYKITNPDGVINIVIGLNKYCIDNGLIKSHMTAISKGKRKTHLGYKCEYYK